MHLEAHAGLGWTLGVLAPKSEPRLRAWAFAAAILPDVDAIAYLFGPVAYMNYHHTFGHNVFLGALVAAAAAASHPRRALAAVVTLLAFGSHLLADMKLSAYSVLLFWPVSRAAYEFTPNLGLGASINTSLVYASGVVVVALAIWRKVTPLELISPRLDRIVVNVFRKKRLLCSTCGRACNECCDGCSKATCTRCAKVSARFRINCPSCERRSRATAATA